MDGLTSRQQSRAAARRGEGAVSPRPGCPEHVRPANRRRPLRARPAELGIRASARHAQRQAAAAAWVLAVSAQSNALMDGLLPPPARLPGDLPVGLGRGPSTACRWQLKTAHFRGRRRGDLVLCLRIGDRMRYPGAAPGASPRTSSRARRGSGLTTGHQRLPSSSPRASTRPEHLHSSAAGACATMVAPLDSARTRHRVAVEYNTCASRK